MITRKGFGAACYRPAGGFTLLEVILASAVCMLLAFVFIAPGLARTQGPARQAVCINNIRNLMQGILMYANDARGFLPPANWGNDQALVPGWLYTPKGNQPPKPNPEGYRSGAVFKYMNDARYYVCPLDNPVNLSFKARANQLSSYVMNGAVCGYGFLSFRTSPTYLLTQFDPRAFCLWQPDENNGDAFPIGPYAYNDGSAYPDRNEGPGAQHSAGTPLGTFGGSVQWVTLKSYAAESKKPTKNLAWCNPGSVIGR